MVTLDKNETAADSWMPCPAVKLEYPGLAYIYTLDELIIVKQRDAFHDLIGEQNYSAGYTIFNNLGQKVFVATAKKRCKKCHIKIFNHYGNEVIQIDRPFKVNKNRFTVWAPPGNFLGAVKELPSCVSTYSVKNWYGLIVLKIRAKGLFKNNNYDVLSYQGVVGRLAKNWQSTAVLGVKKFGISFPLNMHVLDKATLVGACFIIGCLKY